MKGGMLPMQTWEHFTLSKYVDAYFKYLDDAKSGKVTENPIRIGTVDNNGDVHSLSHPEIIVGHISE